MLAWYEASNLELPRRAVTAELRGGYLREQAAIIAALRSRNPDLASELVRKSMTRMREPVLTRLPAEV